jgi:predicted metal-dependent phosphoesterase TrpH
MIIDSGGIPVLAHPIQLRLGSDEKLESIVRELIDLGLAGLEVMHSDHTPDLVSKYTAMADRFNLLKTGGSDFHGTNKKDIELGLARGQRVPREFLDGLFERLRSGSVAKVERE